MSDDATVPGGDDGNHLGFNTDDLTNLRQEAISFGSDTIPADAGSAGPALALIGDDLAARLVAGFGNASLGGAAAPGLVSIRSVDMTAADMSPNAAAAGSALTPEVTAGSTQVVLPDNTTLHLMPGVRLTDNQSN